MQNRTSIGIVAAMMLAAGFIVQADAFAQQTSARVAATAEARQKDEFTRLLDSTKVLNQALKRVSEQKKVDNAALVQANDKKIHDAESAAADGRIATARILVDDAYLNCKLALADLAQKSPSVAQPAPAADAPNPRVQKEYAARMDSTRALRDALERIANEKNDDPGKQEVALIDKLMRDADAQVAQNNAKRGRAILDHAYLRAKVQIERLRGGETLVRELKFDTKEDEYRYELDRNDTYGMLMKLLVQPGGAKEAELKAHVERAARLRKDAEGIAAKKGFEDAVKTMEESSGEYQRALRTAGVMIPG
ncbi:hypothetical protein [Azoarcus sp. KH32C]|uniref:hypothetical protein n=1 Tax=Azoarcus sp. KH32C TaxID=748247 RepID=UPI0002386F9E|nr:hypothetical protein [Azoarcus sp. KH32C]BAL22872.1 hypothetical protein AZKH_0526 [Azoarcus sp. KH32C]